MSCQFCQICSCPSRIRLTPELPNQSQQNVIADVTDQPGLYIMQPLPIPSSHLSCIERKNPSSSKVALKGISGFLRWSSPTLKAKPDMSTGNRRNGLFLPTKPVTHDIDCRIVKPPVYQSKIFTRTDKVRWKWGCFIFFSFASSVYQSSCTISAISARPTAGETCQKCLSKHHG